MNKKSKPLRKIKVLNYIRHVSQIYMADGNKTTFNNKLLSKFISYAICV